MDSLADIVMNLETAREEVDNMLRQLSPYVFNIERVIAMKTTGVANGIRKRVAETDLDRVVGAIHKVQKATNKILKALPEPKFTEQKRCCSRFGGGADLLPDQEWPFANDRPLDFLLQLNLGDISSPLLPTCGLLSIFYDIQNQPWGAKNSCRVIYTKDNHLGSTAHTFRPGTLIGACQSMDGYLSGLQLLGKPNLIQNDTLEVEAERLTLGTPNDVPIDNVTARKKWTLLMQVESKPDVYGCSWGDDGCLYLMIPRSDLKAANFDNACCILQCS
eukprot:6326399-Prymnesium_polylepis.2